MRSGSRRRRQTKDKKPAAYEYNDCPPQPNHIGKMEIQCPHCKALKWPGETPAFCCDNGKVSIPVLPKPPAPLDSLLLGESRESRDFLSKIRSYNSAFQMTSMGCDEILFRRQWNPCYKIQGQIYHRIGSLCPENNEKAKFAQIYFVGNEEEEISLRQSALPGLTPGTVVDLQRMLHSHNSYVRSLKMAHEILDGNEKEYKIVLDAEKRPTGEHERRFNAPSCNEVAVLMVGEESGKRDVVVQYRDSRLQKIWDIHRSYDPLQYPLLFPSGEDGYSIHYPTQNGKNVTCMKFYCHRLMVRPSPDFNALHKSQRLMQQYIVDMAVKVESERLAFLRAKQKQLRAENYSTFADAVLQDDANPQNIGQKVILPSTFIGGPRYMHQRTQDAMSYVRKYGRPSLFITMTCNPSWPEIQDQLFPGQAANHRPDIVARVFNLKRKAMMDEITKKNIFGNVNANVCSIEWQKRGLPHAHILLWLSSNDKIRADDIDSVISAEIPDQQTHPRLYNIVTSHMIHGPCGCQNPSAQCMVDGKCTKGFPKEFNPETKSANDGYPLYRRRHPNHGGRTAVKQFRGNNINVELCNSIKAIKYVIKYVNKGNDMAAYALRCQNSRDEIEIYQAARYLSCSEACYRIFGFSIHDRSPTVVPLQVHLENGQRVLFDEENAREVAENPPETTLTAYFKLCLRYRSTEGDLTADQKFVKSLLYVNIPEYFIYEKKTWKPRKRGAEVINEDGELTSFKKTGAIGRVCTVHPKQLECFFARHLREEGFYARECLL